MGRNPNHEGYFYRQGDYYCWRIVTRGKPIVRKRKTQSELRQAVFQVRKELRDGTADQAKGPKFGEWLQTWLSAHVTRAGLRPKTVRSYSQLAAHVTGQIAKKRLPELTTTDIENLCTNVGGRTGQLLRALLRRAFRDAVRAGIIPRNIASDSEPVKHKTKARKALTLSEVQELLTLAETTRYGPILVILVTTGLRISEALGLSWSDVSGGAIRITRQLQRIGNSWELADLKTDAAKRTIPLTEEGKAALGRMREIQSADRAAAGDGYEINGLVFTTSAGTPMTARNVTRALNSPHFLRRIPRVSPHDLRRTFATLFAPDTDEKTVQSILGHSDIRLTRNVYQVALEPRKAEAIELFGQKLNPNKTRVRNKKQ